MAPPGVNTYFDYLDIMTFSPVYFPVSAPLKPTSSPSRSSLYPAKILSPNSSSTLSSIHSDHDYFIKPNMKNLEYRITTYSGDLCPAQYDSNGVGDAMLSSCAIDSDKVTGNGTDSDFLKELDDLNFNFDDLDPCCEVPMEDSFQEFIDSALEQSYPSFLAEVSNENHTHECDHDDVIFSKEQFLATLNLQQTQENENRSQLWSPSSNIVLPRSSISSLSSLEEAEPDMKYHTRSKLGALSLDFVPTRQCSCMEFESISRAVYSTAHSPSQECVRICPSTLVTNVKDKKCDTRDCSQSKLVSDTLLAPLYIDTSSEPHSEDRLDIIMEEDMVSRIDKDTADIMKWLNESQLEEKQQYNDSNNNFTDTLCTNEASTVAETSHGSPIAPSLDFESFVDLEDFESVCTDNSVSESADIYCAHDITTDKSYSNNTDIPHISHLKLSFLTEHISLRNKLRQGSLSYSESSTSEKVNLKSSTLSHCGLSPAWSTTDSIQSSISPQPLTSLDLSLSSNFEDVFDDNSVKSPSALLNLFSDENATSLLHTDSTVPNFRFM